jgi:hypothetical protein
MPIYHIQFLSTIGTAYTVMHTNGHLSPEDIFALNLFKLNIKYIDLPNIDDPGVIEAYENALALQFNDIRDVNYKSLIDLLYYN